MASDQPIEYVLIETKWVIELPERPASERGILQAALQESGRTPYIISLDFLIFTDWATFDTEDNILRSFVAKALGIRRYYIHAIMGRKNRNKKYLKLMVDFKVPFEVEKMPCFFSASFETIYSSHKETKTYLCRMEQPQITDYLENDVYNGYMAQRYNA